MGIPVSRRLVCVLAAAFSLAALPSLTALGADPLPVRKAEGFSPRLDLSGGQAQGMSLRQVRWGDHHTFERIVFEFADPSGRGDLLPRLSVRTEEYPLRLVVTAPLTAAAHEGVFVTARPFEKSRFLSGVDLLESCADLLSLAVIPARPVDYEVFTLTSPPRLVVDVRVSTAPIPSGEERYSLRTMSLLGDQSCVFLQEARGMGLSPRLLKDSAGQTFGEVALFPTPDGAFREKSRLESLGARFSLYVKARGIMDVPGPIP